MSCYPPAPKPITDFTLILVLFILLVIIGTAFVKC
ncbi:YjcZ family sporulation protein [Anaerobacillus alkalilacustris]|nr:YjcZ family sporulation protein [Anaerobacillus alkalilacustris]